MYRATVTYKLKYALLAVIFAVGSIIALEEAGIALTGSHSGLGGRLPAPAPTAALVSSTRGEQASQPTKLRK
jgi:hypothetical protein